MSPQVTPEPRDQGWSHMDIWGRESQVSPGDSHNCEDSKLLFSVTKLGDACYTAADNRKAKIS